MSGAVGLRSSQRRMTGSVAWTETYRGAVLERQPVVVVPDVQHVPQAFGQPVDETEVAPVGASADAGGFYREPQ
jgi:hypothetical protein